MKKIIAIVQARTDSSRFPKKILEKINGQEIIKIIFKRLKKSKKIDKIILATTKKKSDDFLSKIISKMGIAVYRGSENNVLSRYYNVNKIHKADYIVRITGDCPFVDAKIVDLIIDQTIKSKADYCSNVIKYTLPDGFDVEVFSKQTLKFAFNNAKNNFDKEHVTPLMLKSNKLKKVNYEISPKNTNYRLCLDQHEDFQLIKKIFMNFKPDIYFGYKKLLNFLKKNKKISKINSHILQNEGSYISKGQKLWRNAKRLIPGGSMLLSKNPDRFLPNLWPAYYDRAKGCYIWGLEGKKYLDMSNMGVGTNVLGYSNKKIDNKVTSNIKKSNLTTLLCPEEVELAEKLIKLHPDFHMVRFARTGGEANAIAIRIARNFVKSDKVAICGYHGWHDWYLAANLKKGSLDNHLLKGLNADGVPYNLKDTIFPFEYNNFEKLKKIVKKNKIKIIKMEVIRNIQPKNNFLKKIESFAKKNKIILIFDECTTGFRETFGAIYPKFKVKPNIVIFGKTLGNGYAVNAILGEKKIMQKAENTFISSTFWTERIGSTAALATISEMERIKSWEIVKKIGKRIKKKWKNISKKKNVPITVSGLDSLCKFDFKKNNEIYKTFLTQEMLKKGILANNSVYVSIAHDKKQILDRYFCALEEVFAKIRLIERKKLNMSSFLDTIEPIKDFKRLN